MKDIRPSEGIIGEQASDGLSDQTRLLLLSCDTGNGPRRGTVKRSQKQLRTSSTSATAPISSSCELGGVKTGGGRSNLQTARANTAVSPHMSNPTAERRDIAKQVLDQLRKVTERSTADIIACDFNNVGLP